VAGIASIGLFAAQRQAFEVFELAEEVLDEVAPWIDLFIDVGRIGAARMLGDDVVGPSGRELVARPVVVEGFVGDQPPNVRPAISSLVAILSWRWPGKSAKRTRLPSASVKAAILVVQPPREAPIA
jgi:hypothetical protein